MNIQKLRIYAICQRLIELENERLENERFKKLSEVFVIRANPKLESFTHLYDKNGKLFEPSKSKFHK